MGINKNLKQNLKKCKTTNKDKWDFKERLRWPRKTWRLKSKKPTKSMMDSSAYQTLKMPLLGTTSSSDSKWKNTRVVFTWVKSSALQNIQQKHQWSAQSLKMEDSIVGKKASAFQYHRITQNHGTLPGKLVTLFSVSSLSGNRQMSTLTELSKKENGLLRKESQWKIEESH